MPATFKTNGVSIAFGLSWTPPTEKKKDGIAFAKKRKANYQIGVNVGKKVSYGVGRFPLKTNKKAALFSGAVLFQRWSASYARDTATELGGVKSNFLLVFKFKDESKDGFAVGLVAIVEGNIYRDITIAADETIKAIADIEGETGVEFEKISNLNDAIPEATPIDAITLLGVRHKDAQMVKAQTVNYVILFAMLLSVLVIGLACAYWFIQQKKLEEAEEAKQVDPVQLYQASLLPLLKSAGYSGNSAKLELWPTISNLELSSSGWTLQRIDCVRNQCKQYWKRATGTNADFANDHRGKGSIYFVDKGTLEYTVPINTKPIPLDIKSLPDFESFNLKYVSTAQQLESLAGVAKIEILIEKPLPYGVPNNITENDIPRNMLVKKGQLTIKSAIGMYPDILSELPSNFSISRIDINLQSGLNSANVTISGDYYVK